MNGGYVTYDREIAEADRKASILYNISHQTEISGGDDLNDYNIPGVYCSISNDITQALVNTPSGIYGNFKMLVNVNTGSETGSGNWYGSQIILSGYEIYTRSHVGSTWESWKRLRYEGDETEKIVYVTLSNVTIPDGATTGQEIDLDMTSYIPSGFSLWSANVLVHSGTVDYTLPWFNTTISQTLRVNRLWGKHVYLYNNSTGWGTCTIYLTLFLKKS